MQAVIAIRAHEEPIDVSGSTTPTQENMTEEELSPYEPKTRLRDLPVLREIDSWPRASEAWNTNEVIGSVGELDTVTFPGPLDHLQMLPHTKDNVELMVPFLEHTIITGQISILLMAPKNQLPCSFPYTSGPACACSHEETFLK